jgi:hypothetical protein
VATETNNGKVSEEEAAERRPTERVILERVRVVVLPDAMTPEQQAAISAALHAGKGKVRTVPVEEAWREVARKVGSSKRAAIEEYAGKAGTPDAKVGVFRAPSTTAWKGGVENTAPPLPLVESRVIE